MQKLKDDPDGRMLRRPLKGRYVSRNRSGVVMAPNGEPPRWAGRPSGLIAWEEAPRAKIGNVTQRNHDAP